MDTVPESKCFLFQKVSKLLASNSTLWAFLLVVGILAGTSFLIRHENTIENQTELDQSAVELFDQVAADSPLISFGPEDVTISRGWTILAGIHPAVTFCCRFNSPNKLFDRAILCYRIKGSSSWMTAEARLRRDNSAKLVLCDLHRNTTYECLYILIGHNCIVKSKTVTFTT